MIHCDIDNYIHAGTALMRRHGVTLEVGTDFALLKVHCENAEGRAPLNPSFDVLTAEGRGVSGIWLIGRNAEGAIIHTQAMKCVFLNGKSLLTHLQESGHQYRIGGLDLDLSKAEVALTRDAAAINGTFGYHGEVWSAPGSTGLRHTDLALLSRIMLAYGIQELQPGHMLGFISPQDAYRGLSAKLGYVHLEQRTVCYPLAGGSDVLEGWMVWMSAEEAIFNLRIEPEFFSRELIKNKGAINRRGRAAA